MCAPTVSEVVASPFGDDLPTQARPVLCACVCVCFGGMWINGLRPSHPIAGRPPGQGKGSGGEGLEEFRRMEGIFLALRRCAPPIGARGALAVRAVVLLRILREEVGSGARSFVGLK